MALSPAQTQHQRQVAWSDFTGTLSRLASSQLVIGDGGALDGAIARYRDTLRQIEQNEHQSIQQRYEEQQLQTEYNRWQAGAYQPGAQPLNRGEAGPRPTPGSEEEAIQQAMNEMAQRGIGRI